MTEFPDLDIGALKTDSIYERESLVSRRDFGRPWTKGGGLRDFLDRLPRILAGSDWTGAVERLCRTVKNGATLVLAMGGHPVKVGLSPLIIDLMDRGIISLLAVNGSVMVHDTEVAMVGSTSEDVAASLGAGHFGVTREPNKLINAAAREAAESGTGLGLSLGRAILKAGLPHAGESLFASAAQREIPVTVHVALGTDVYHIHPEADGAYLGKAGFADFQTFCRAVASMENGAFINLGSAVVLPEVFLKAVTLSRNLGFALKGLTTVNMDFIRQYRPQVNVVQRPTTIEGGKGFYFVGHHELMFPLLAASLIEGLAQ